jgi:hypothetical protein
MTQKSAQAVVRALQYPGPNTASDPTLSASLLLPLQDPAHSPVSISPSEKERAAAGSDGANGKEEEAPVSEEKWTGMERTEAKVRAEKAKRMESEKIQEILGRKDGKRELVQMQLLRELAQSPRDRANQRKASLGSGERDVGLQGIAAVVGKNRRIESDEDIAAEAEWANGIRERERERARGEEMAKKEQEAALVAEQMQRAKGIAEMERYVCVM